MNTRFYNFPQFAGSQMSNAAPNSAEPSFSFTSAMCEDTQSFMHNYLQNNYYQPPFQPLDQDVQLNNSTTMLNMPQLPQPSCMDDDLLLQDFLGTDGFRPSSDMTFFNNDMNHEPLCGVMLPQNLVDQILSQDTNQDSSSVLELLRSNIIQSIETQQAPAPDTRPPLTTESIFNEKKEMKKGGVKKRRYVKSGLYRKDKNGNFIYSSSDRARLAQEDGKTEQTTPQEQSEPSTPGTSGTRVKRPLNAYNIFCKLHFDQVKTENPELSINELSKLMGEKWKSMSANQKKTYYDKVEHGQTRYKKPLNSYNLYCKKNFDALKKEFPQKSIHVLSKVIAERWKKLSEVEKRVYYDEAERQKKQGQQQQELEESITAIESSETLEQKYAPEFSYDVFL